MEWVGQSSPLDILWRLNSSWDLCLRASSKKYGSLQFRMVSIRRSKVNQYTTYSEVVSTMTLLSGCKLRVLNNACYKSWRNSTIVGCLSATKIGPGEAKRRFSKHYCYCYFVYNFAIVNKVFNKQAVVVF